MKTVRIVWVDNKRGDLIIGNIIKTTVIPNFGVEIISHEDGFEKVTLIPQNSFIYITQS